MLESLSGWSSLNFFSATNHVCMIQWLFAFELLKGVERVDSGK